MSGEWIPVTERLPEDGLWCWVSDGIHTWIAKRDLRWSGGWTNEDTWEDFNRVVTQWVLIPEPPGVK